MLSVLWFLVEGGWFARCVGSEKRDLVQRVRSRISLSPPWTDHTQAGGELLGHRKRVPSSRRPEPASPQWHMKIWQPATGASICRSFRCRTPQTSFLYLTYAAMYNKYNAADSTRMGRHLGRPALLLFAAAAPSNNVLSLIASSRLHLVRRSSRGRVD